MYSVEYNDSFNAYFLKIATFVFVRIVEVPG